MDFGSSSAEIVVDSASYDEDATIAAVSALGYKVGLL